MRLISRIAVYTACLLPFAAFAEEPQWRHGTSLLGKLKYPAGFERFDYVNPVAPKGGQVRLSDTGSFDSFHPVLPKGSAATGLGLVFERLMTSSMDEVSAEYGLIAEALKYPDDYSWVTYRLNPKAKWHDGKPITPEDVVWSFEQLVEISPQQRFYYRHVEKAEITGPGEITFTFKEKGNRELPHIVGQLLVLPKHWWQGTNADGVKRDVRKSTLEPPLGSGPYRISKFVAGRSLTYARVADYWGADLNVNIGSNNIETIRYEYYRDSTVEFEAFKADAYDWRQESTARVWATSYDFKAVKSNRVLLKTYEEPYRSSGLMVGFILNTRRDKLADPRVRRALNYAFDFEGANKVLFFSQYNRIDSYFDGIELESTGLPQGLELEILNTVKDGVPAEVFTTPYTNPVTGDNTASRANLRQAFQLLQAAGWKRDGNRLVNAKTGKQFEIEYLTNNPGFEKIGLRYQNALKRLGISFKIRVVDTTQFINRIRARDFDVIYSGWAQSMSPGNEQLEYFGSAAADRSASQNYAGIKNPAIDTLINRVIFAKDRVELIAATRALDRVLLWNHYVVPGWTLRLARIARWDRFSHPEKLPNNAIGFPTIWWYDEAKAAKTGAAK